MRLPQAAVYEVATFYAHFDVVKEGETPPPPDHHKGVQLDHLRAQGRRGAVRRRSSRRRPVRSARAARAVHGPVRYGAGREVGHLHVDHATPKSVLETLVDSGRREPEIPILRDASRVSRERRLFGARELPRGQASVSTSIINDMTDAGLRGLGGAGFPAGRKWQIVRAYHGAAPDDHQRRRGRARHLQGPLLS